MTYYTIYDSRSIELERNRRSIDENSTHISLPQFDIERYRQNYNRLRKIPTYIFIGKPMEIFAIVKLEGWLHTAFEDYNESLLDNQKQSVICLKQTRSIDRKVEIKTVDHYCWKVLVKTSEWHGNDYMVAWQINKEETEFRMIGWLTKQQVEGYPKTPKGETKYNPHSEAYIIDIKAFNPTNTFIDKLLAIKK